MPVDAERIEHAGSQRNANEVVDESPEKVLCNHPHRALTQVEGAGNVAQVIAHERHLCHIHRHIGASPNGHAHVGQGQRLRVVDAVTNHGYGVTFALQLAHKVLLVLW